MTTETTTNKVKRLPLKNATHAHVFPDGSISIGYEDRHKASGKMIYYDTKIEAAEMPFKVSTEGGKWNEVDRERIKNFKYKSIYFDRYSIALLNDCIKLEVWPVNHSYDSSFGRMSVILQLKNGAHVSFDEICVNGQIIYSPSCKIMR